MKIYRSFWLALPCSVVIRTGSYRRVSGILATLMITVYMVLLSSCANMVPPTGGPKDTTAPLVVRSIPGNGMRNFRDNRITLQFSEYVEVENAYENVIVSPAQANAPIINARLRTVTIELKDTLEPNTTYAIQFGNAIKDINEGNPLQNFNYVFSTGDVIDSLMLSGRVILAQTGKTDSTLIVMLHRNLTDSAVAKERPRYFTRLDGKGNFTFRYLPPGTFRLYALKDEGFRRYTDERTVFAFANSPITIGSDNAPQELYAFVADPGEEAANRRATPSAGKEGKEEKQLRYQLSLQSGEQDLLSNLHLTFSNKLALFDSARIILADTLYRPVSGYALQLDTGRQRMTLNYPWKENQFFRLILPKEAVKDSAGLTLAKNDTIRIRTRPESEYGSMQLRFTGVDFSRNPVLQWLQSNQVVRTDALTGPNWRVPLFAPGNYELRILYDENKNGRWDTGDFWQHRQPEIAVSVNQAFNVRANWDNEFTVGL